MKKIKLKQQLLCVSLLFTCLLQAQLDKKTWLVGGNASFSSDKDESFTTLYTGEISNLKTDKQALTLNPKIGFFIIDKFAVGLVTTIYYSKQIQKRGVDINGPTYNSYSYVVGPFVRYYLLNKEKSFNILTEITSQFGTQHFGSYDKGKSNVFSFFVGPEVFFNSSVGVEFLLGYKMQNTKIEHTELFSANSNSFQVAIGLQIHLEK